MKKITPSRNTAGRLICSALVASALVTGLSAATKSSTASPDASTQATEHVKVTRATGFLGSDVMSSDGHKVGDIADYYYDVSATPHLRYVIVVSGGVLGIGDDARAVPADAISTDGDTVQVKLSRDNFWDVAVLPQNRALFLGEQRNIDRLDQAFALSDSQDKNTSADTGSPQLVAFSDLQNSEVYDRDGNRVGRFVDTWMNLNDDRAPYVEISSPPPSPFRVVPRLRIAVAMSQLELPDQNHDSYRVKLTSAELQNSKSVSDVQGVQLLRSDALGPEALRVRVAQD